ncbi:hypothetical protein B0H34DRAFT_665975 [Crassisporium funariophilum]|nr:hypothetical protein B0H34DRAFT_665975 [Crassisporium funariophilum]
MDVDSVTVISLDAPQHSSITNVNLYSGRAQITRVFKFDVTAGQSEVVISQLPNVVDHESLRVEGRGAVTIHGVASSKLEMEDAPTTSIALSEISEKELKAESALERCKKASKSIQDYMSKLDVQYLDITKLGDAMDIYDNTQEKWDEKIIKIESALDAMKEARRVEEEKLANKGVNKKLRTQAVIGLFAEQEAEVEMILIYMVSHASWTAGYDIRVDTQNPGSPVKVIYKAAINQRTGENWERVPITLETAIPTFGLQVPRLSIWKVSHTKLDVGAGLGRGGAMRHRKITAPDPDDLDFNEWASEGTFITSKGNVSATFRIPGMTTIPHEDEDDEMHNVTIADLDLEAVMSWVCIPKGDQRVHLKATITNSSGYTFLPGPSNVYVDQSYIACSDIPNVSPSEVFECPLGLDPSIRVTYHPRTKMVSESGFYSKSTTHAFSQRITIHNYKTVDVQGVKVTDHIPVSQDANIIVNLISPALTIPSPSTSLSKVPNGKTTVPPPVEVADGVVAQWNGGVEEGGKDGRLDWICSIPALTKISLLLHWEVVTTQQKAEIFGL